MYQDLVNIFFKNVYSKAEAFSRLASLKSYLIGALFSTDKNHAQNLDPNQIIWLNLLGKDFYLKINQQNVYDILKEIEEVTNSIQPLVIYLPFQFPDSELPILGAHIRKLFGENFLIDIKYDPELIAGPAMVWKGVYKDYSIRQSFKDHRSEILTNFKQLIH